MKLKALYVYVCVRAWKRKELGREKEKNFEPNGRIDITRWKHMDVEKRY